MDTSDEWGNTYDGVETVSWLDAVGRTRAETGTYIAKAEVMENAVVLLDQDGEWIIAWARSLPAEELVIDVVVE